MHKVQMTLIAFGIIIVLLATLTASFFIRINDLQNQLNTLQTDKNNLLSQNNLLENQLSMLQGQISNLTLSLELMEIPLLRYKSLDLGIFALDSDMIHNLSIPDSNSPVFTGGYGELSVYYIVEDVSPGSFTFTIALSSILWYNGVPGQQAQYGGPVAYETVNALNRTIVRNSQGFSSTYVEPFLTQTKAPYFTLGFSTNTDSADWQNIKAVIRVFVYLRN